MILIGFSILLGDFGLVKLIPALLCIINIQKR